MNKYCLIIVAALFIFSCKSEPKQSKPVLSDAEIFQDIPSDFVDFYNQFHSDSNFQLNHIIFPLAVKEGGSKWQKRDWKIHKAFDDQNGAYTRSFNNFSGIIFEFITEKTGAFKIEKRYSKFGDSYNLIYYKSQIQIEGWKPEDK